MKKVLLLGDSIRLHYQPLVKEKLEGLADISGPADNCRFVKYTLWHVNEWIQQLGKPDIVHWNNGIWDTFVINKDIGIFTPVEEYLCDIGRVLKELRKTEAEIIWATTTPVSNRNINCSNKVIDQYNDRAVEFMMKENIRINDLNLLVKADIESCIAEDLIHLNEKGKTICAEAVSNAIAECLSL